MRLDVLYFIGCYDIDEDFSRHGIISRARQLFPVSVFNFAFTHVFELFISKGMVSSHTQAIDNTPIKANASIDSLELKFPFQDL